MMNKKEKLRQQAARVSTGVVTRDEEARRLSHAAASSVQEVLKEMGTSL